LLRGREIDVIVFRIRVGDIVVINVSVIILADHEFNTKEFEDIFKEWLRQGGLRLVRDKQKVAEGKKP